MPNGGHVGENAELYALGTLSELERARVDEHVRTCDPCAQRVGEAEETALRLIDAAKMPAIPLPAVRFASRARLPAWMAPAAAAFVAGFIVTGLWSQRDRAADDAARSTTQAAQRAMLAGHFSHAPFVAREPDAPAAKVVYAREGGWLYVIAAAGPQALDVAVERDGTRTTVASLAAGDTTRSVFIGGIGRVRAVELVARGRPIAVARIVYAGR
ncbi:MAG: zf-HC2 domain-containing protein [Candidatus Eremiobacteraeota bacterium]|nr:zf-HC2 domain-containing protein [Candidatus Eremiobacteraeota bacterium]